MLVSELLVRYNIARQSELSMTRRFKLALLVRYPLRMLEKAKCPRVGGKTSRGYRLVLELPMEEACVRGHKEFSSMYLHHAFNSP